MQYLRLGLGLFAIVTIAVPAMAQDKPALPATTACPTALAEIATCYSAKHESGAYLLAAMPKNWNGNLVVFAHGGPAVVPPTATTSQNDLARYSYLVKSGYGWVASSYRREGYGVRFAAEDSEHARRFFVERIGKPRRTIMHGQSYGGLVSTKVLELHGKSADGSLNYDGAFLNSGFVIGAAQGHDFRADLRAVYQYYCKNLPRPDEAQYPLWSGIPAASTMTLKVLEALVDECTGIAKQAAARSDVQKQNLANILGVMRFSAPLLVRHLQASTFLFREIAERTTQGRSAFSNMVVEYRGSTDDVALNRGIVRFDSDPAAVAALKADGEPTGALPVPVISVHSMNDPQVAVEVQSVFRRYVEAAGNGDRLVQAYTDENQHSGQSAPEVAASYDALMLWIEKGTKPTAQSIATRCGELLQGSDGLCRYHPEFQPKSYSTRYARGAVATQ
jgi:hypothetical protein